MEANRQIFTLIGATGFSKSLSWGCTAGGESTPVSLAVPQHELENEGHFGSSLRTDHFPANVEKEVATPFQPGPQGPCAPAHWIADLGPSPAASSLIPEQMEEADFFSAAGNLACRPAVMIPFNLPGDGLHACAMEAGSPSPSSLDHATSAAGSTSGMVFQTSSNSPGRRRNLRELPPEVTTLVIRNIPARYTKEKLLEEFVPDGRFDLLHFPYDIEAMCTSGYAFINFVSHEAALDFQKEVHGTYPKHGRGKHFDVRAAEVQGFQATLSTVNANRKLQRYPFEEMVPAVFSGKTRLPTWRVLEKLRLKFLKVESLESYRRAAEGGWSGQHASFRPPTWPSTGRPCRP